MSNLGDFKSFARRHLGVELNPSQIKMYEAVRDGKTLYRPRKMGITTFNKIWKEYNQSPHNNS